MLIALEIFLNVLIFIIVLNMIQNGAYILIHLGGLYMVITLYDLDIKFSDFYNIALDILLFNSAVDTVDYRSFHNDCLIAFLDRGDLNK